MKSKSQRNLERDELERKLEQKDTTGEIDVEKMAEETEIESWKIKIILGLALPPEEMFSKYRNKDMIELIDIVYRNTVTGSPDCTKVRILTTLSLLKLCNNKEDFMTAFNSVIKDSYEESLVVKELAQFFTK